MFVDASYPRKRYLNEEVDETERTQKMVYTWLIERQKGEDSEIIDLFSIIHLPKDVGQNRFCQLYYLSASGNKTETLAILAI